MNKKFEDITLLSDTGIPGSTLFSRTMCDTLAVNVPTRLLDIGCGSGVVGLYALLNGCEFVCFNDIQSQALVLTEKNLQQQQIIDDRYQLHSAPFQDIALDINDFDAIAFNPPQLPTDSVSMSQFGAASERIFRDGGANGRRLINLYIEWLAEHLTANCRAYLGVSSLLSVADVLSFAQKLGLSGVKKQANTVPLREILYPVADKLDPQEQQKRELVKHDTGWSKKIYVLEFQKLTSDVKA